LVVVPQPINGVIEVQWRAHKHRKKLDKEHPKHYYNTKRLRQSLVGNTHRLVQGQLQGKVEVVHTRRKRTDKEHPKHYYNTKSRQQSLVDNKHHLVLVQ